MDSASDYRSRDEASLVHLMCKGRVVLARADDDENLAHILNDQSSYSWTERE